MPSTRARTCATRNAEVRPGSSVVIGTLPRCTVTTETCGGGGVVAGLAEPQPTRTMAANAGAIPIRQSVIRSGFMSYTVRSLDVWVMMTIVRCQPISRRPNRISFAIGAIRLAMLDADRCTFAGVAALAELATVTNSRTRQGLKATDVTRFAIAVIDVSLGRQKLQSC